MLIFINDEQITLTCDVGNGLMEVVDECETLLDARNIFEGFAEIDANEFVCCQLSCSDQLH